MPASQTGRNRGNNEKTVANPRIEGYHNADERDPVIGFFVHQKEAVMVSLSDGAVNKFKEVVSQQGAAGDGVRIFVVPGG